MPRRLLALYNLFTAAAFVLLAGRVLPTAATATPARVLLAALLLLACGAGFAAFTAWRGSKVGPWLTILYQALQLPQLASSSLTYLVSLPFGIVGGLTPAMGLHWHATWHPGLEITPDGYQSSPWFGVNLWALGGVVLAVSVLRHRSAVDDLSPNGTPAVSHS